MMDMMNQNWGAFSGMAFLFGLLNLAFWVLLIVGLVYAIRWLIRKSEQDSGRSKPLDVLGERYARGEIGKEEYEQKRADLMK